MTLEEVQELEEWEAQGLLSRLHCVRRATAEAYSGKRSVGGVDDEFEEVFSSDGTVEEGL